MKLGGKHVLKFSFINYLAFLLLLTLVFSFKNWKKVYWSFLSFIIAFFAALSSALVFDLKTDMKVIKLMILLTIVLLALFNIVKTKKRLKGKEKTAFVFVILFAIFNGLGFANDFELQIGVNDHKFIPLLESLLGVATSTFLMIAGLLAVNSFVIRKFNKKNKYYWVLGCSLILGVFFFQKIISSMFY